MTLTAPTLRADVAFPMASGIPEDAVHNVWHFEVPDDDHEDAMTVITSIIEFFYNADPGAGASIAGHMAGLVLHATLEPTVTFYEIPEDPGPVGAPVGETEFSAFAPNDIIPPLPSEVAVCLSMHGSLAGLSESVPGAPVGPAGDTHPRARRRGRLFLGPLSQGAADTTSGRPLAQFRENIGIVAASVRDSAGLAAAGVSWAVFSPTNWDTVPVIGGWVDDAFDTQRRRGVAPTTRDVW